MREYLRLFNIRSLLSLVFTLLTQIIFAGHALALDISDVRFGVHPDKTRLVLDLSQTSDFRAFVLPDPYRLVIDLPSFKWNAGAINRPAGTNITAVRHGNLKPGISRIVFDLDTPVSVRSAFTLPKQSAKPDRLVIDYTQVSAAVFTREKNKIYGTLNKTSAALANSRPVTATPEQRTASLSATPPPPKPPSKRKKPLIVIDPGHGGVDPGAVGAGKILEKNIVLALGKELKKQLEATGRYRVMLTRETDSFIKLRDRVKFARKYEANLFVSLHADSIKEKNVSGASFYTLSEKASDAQTARIAAHENKADLIAGIDLSIEDDDVASILVDLAMRDTTNQAKFFANKLVSTFKNKNVHTLDNAHRHAGFAVLKAPDVPSVLIEAGFMSNKKEARMLNSSSYRKKVSSALVKGIHTYFEQVRKNQRI